MGSKGGGGSLAVKVKEVLKILNRCSINVMPGLAPVRGSAGKDAFKTCR